MKKRNEKLDCFLTLFAKLAPTQQRAVNLIIKHYDFFDELTDGVSDSEADKYIALARNKDDSLLLALGVLAKIKNQKYH